LKRDHGLFADQVLNLRPHICCSVFAPMPRCAGMNVSALAGITPLFYAQICLS